MQIGCFRTILELVALRDIYILILNLFWLNIVTVSSSVIVNSPAFVS